MTINTPAWLSALKVEMFGESLYRCFSGFRRHSYATTPLPAAPPSPSSSCPPSPVVFKHFNSLYDPVSDSETTTTTTTLTLTLSSSAAVAAAGGSSFSSSCNARDDGEEGYGGGGGSCPSEHDLSSAIASRRLLPASPGRSNSIVDSTAVVAVGVGAGVAVPTYSPDPHRDFRRSMEEMVAALGLDAGDRRAHLLELLHCYLALNQKHAHKYIMSAFADLLQSRASTPADVEDGRS